MNPVTLHAFSDELQKIAGLGDLWQRFLGIFRSKPERVERRVNYQFDPKAGPDKWDKLVRNANDPKFVAALSRHPKADPKLVLHAKSMGDLSRGRPVAKIKSSTSPGKTYEVRELVGGALGCQCNDWRYKGSVTSGYECRHIRAHKQGKMQA